MYEISNQLSNAFTDTKKITKHVFILVGNTPTRIDVPIGRLCNVKANESKSCLKGGRLVSSKYTIPWNKKTRGKTYEKVDTLVRVVPKNDLLKLID